MARPLLPIAVLVAGAALLYFLLRQTHTAPLPVPGRPSGPEHIVEPRSNSTPRSGSATPPATNAFRLAGTVVGDVSYAVIEDPDGSNDLYGRGQEVPGLGRLIEVGPRSAVFVGERGRVVLRLRPAATPTSAPEATARPTSPPPDRFPEESSPSAGPDRPVS